MKKLLVLALVLAFVGAVQAESIWITDSAAKTVNNYSMTGTLLSSFSVADTTQNPMDVAMTSTGNLYVSLDGGGGNSSVREYTTSGTYVGMKRNGLYSPAGIDVDSAGNLYIANSQGRRFIQNSPGGGNYYLDPGNSNYVSDVAVNNATGEVYSLVYMINGTYSGVVPIFKSSASDYPTITQTINGITQYGGGVTVDNAGNLWASSMENQQILKFDSLGNVVQTLGIVGGGRNVKGLDFDSAGNLYAVISRTGAGGNARLDKYNFATSSWSTVISGLTSDSANYFTIVPEPATLMLLGLGALSMLRRKK